jgi:hypothetical protein
MMRYLLIDCFGFVFFFSLREELSRAFSAWVGMMNRGVAIF